MKVSERVAQRFILRVAMSLEQAKAVLGFPPNATPSDSEIERARRQKAIENHPDRGGDLDKMVEVNVAADVLIGKQKPTYEPNYRPSPRAPTPRPPRQAPPTQPRRTIGVSFDEAASKADVPSSVTWWFVTDTAHSGYSSDEYENRSTGYVVVGETDGGIVFVTVEHTYRNSYVIGDSSDVIDAYAIKTVTVPKRGTMDAQFIYGGVKSAWRRFENLKKEFNSKIVPLPDGWVFSDKRPHSGMTTIKNYLLDKGVMQESALRTPRKYAVEVHYERSHEDKPGFYQKALSGYRSDWEKISLIINGRPFDLNEAQTKELGKLRIGGSNFMDRVFGTYYYGGETKNLTRNRAGKDIMKWMLEHLPNLPDAVVTALTAASAAKAAP